MGTKKVIYAGKEYSSIREFTEALGLSYGTFVKVLRETNNVAEALDKVQKSNRKKTRRCKVVVFGREFTSFESLAAYYGLSYSTLVPIIDSGFSIEDGIREAMSKTEINFNGVTYRTFRELCKEYLISDEIVAKRLRYGYSLEEALTEAVKPKLGRTVSHNGIKYESISFACRDLGINIGTIRRMKKTYGISFEECFSMIATFLDTLKGERPAFLMCMPTVIYNGIWYDSYDKLSQEFGLLTLDKRDGDITIFDTLGRLKEKTKTVYIYNDVEYSHNDIKKVLGVSHQTVATRVKRGIIQTKEVPLYPTLQAYNPTGYCVDARVEYMKYKEKLGITIKKKR